MQAPDAQCTDQGFYHLPTTTKAVALCLPSFTLATAAALTEGKSAGSANSEGLQWVCRCSYGLARYSPQLPDLLCKTYACISVCVCMPHCCACLQL